MVSQLAHDLNIVDPSSSVNNYDVKLSHSSHAEIDGQ